MSSVRSLKVLLCAAMNLYFLPSNAQFSGGHDPGQAAPAKAEKAALTGGPVGGNVDLFTGALSLSYDLGEVATLSGLSFPLRLSYSSTASVSTDREQNGGIPYGEGWNLSSASITVENYAFDYLDNEIQRDVNLRAHYTVPEADRVGQIYFANPELHLPNGISGHLVFKYAPANANVGEGIYVLEGFDRYVEAEFNGKTWTVRLDDGTQYIFNVLQYAYRNAGANTAWLHERGDDALMPQMQAVKWHLGEINNPNHPAGQRLVFDYYMLGGYGDLYPEYFQTQVRNVLQGSHPTFYSEKVYQDVLLKSVIAKDSWGVIHSQVVLKYKSWEPHEQLPANDVRLGRGKFLQLSDVNVLRQDSLYSRTTVYFRGIDDGYAQLQGEYGMRPPMATNTPFEGSWQRYQHPMAYQNPLSRFVFPQQPEVNPGNPYIAKFPNGINNFFSGAVSINPNAEYWMSRNVSNVPVDNIPFTHSVLESPRIVGTELENMPGGDWYEVRTTMEVPEGLDMNFDVNVVSGVDRLYNPATSTYYQSANGGGESWNIRLNNAPYNSMIGGGANNGWDDRSYPLYSSFRNLVKWNPLQQSNGFSLPIVMTTRNLFRMPNLPQEFGGFVVQVGPAADNLIYDSVTVNSSVGYPNYYKQPASVGFTLGYQQELQLGNWFGTGAPIDVYRRWGQWGIEDGNAQTFAKGPAQDRWFFWYHHFGAILNGNVGVTPNQPTAVTKEEVNPGLNGTFAWNQFDQVHTTTETVLKNVEIVRISKNPWMLDSVIFYSAAGAFTPTNGPWGDPGGMLVRSKAIHLSYDLSQVPVVNNIERGNASIDAVVAASVAAQQNYLYVNFTLQYRNLFQLAGIERLGVDSVGRYTPIAPLVTRFEYYEDDMATVDVCEAFFAKAVYNELGGKDSYVYGTPYTTSEGAQSPVRGKVQDQNWLVAGGSKQYAMVMPVAEKISDDGTPDGMHTYYQFQNLRMLSKGYSIDAHFNGKKNDIGRHGWTVGFEKAIVRQELIMGPQRARTEFTHRVSTGSIEDTLLFGRLIRTESYDENGQLLNRTVNTFAATRAYPSGFDYPNAQSNLTTMGGDGHVIQLPVTGVFLNSALEYEKNHLNGSGMDWRCDSWFTRQVKLVNEVRDPVSGNLMSDTVKFTFYDWDFDQNRNDTEGDYAEMYGHDPAASPQFMQEEWYVTVNDFSRYFEPSWQPASKRTTWKHKPRAFTEERFYYLYDAYPFLRDADGYSMSFFEGSMRPFWLARKNGIRSTGIEQMVTSWNGNPAERPYRRSTYYWNEVFTDVTVDFLFKGDTTYLGRLCSDNNGNNGGGNGGGGNGGGIFVGDVQFLGYIFDAGEQVAMNRVTSEILNDPRYVEDTLGRWWYFPVKSVHGVRTSDYESLVNGSAVCVAFADATTQAAFAGTSAGGYAQGFDSKVKYFGHLSGRTTEGQTITFDAGALRTADRNYGSELLPDSGGISPNPVTDASLMKKTLLVFSPHRHPNGYVCPRVHPYANDSALNAEFQATLEREAVDPLDTLGGPQMRENMIDVIGNQFFLRAVYVQVDSMVNVYGGDSLNNVNTPSRHNVFRPILENPVYPANGAENVFHFRPQYAVVRSYRVHQRNLYGLPTDESDARHLHVVTEYSPGYFATWFDECGRRFNNFVRYGLGLPVSMTRNDFGTDSLAANLIEQTAAYDYWPDRSLRQMTGPNGDRDLYLFDAQKRLAEAYHDFGSGLLSTGTIDYQTWGGNTADSWISRIQQNKVHTLTPDGNGHTVEGMAFVDPLGRTAQSIEAVQVGALYVKHFSGAQVFDNWGRVTGQQKPYHLANANPPAFNNAPQNLGMAETRYENDSRGRALRASKPGNAITGARTVRNTYAIIPISQFVTETGISAAQRDALFPQIAALIAGGGNAAIYNQYFVSKTQSEDEDGKRSLSYSDATGLSLATLAYADAAYSDKVVTLYFTDAAGRVNKVVNAMGQVSTTRYNFSGQAIETVTPDAGRKRVAYNQAGDIKFYQDENLRAQGRYFVFEYDRLGRVVRQKTAVLSNAPTDNIAPLDYSNTQFTSTWSIVDELWSSGTTYEEGNGPNHEPTLYNATYTQHSWPWVYHAQTAPRTEKEFRWDYGWNAALPPGVNGPQLPYVFLNQISPTLRPRVQTAQHLNGRLAFEKVYDETGRWIEATYHSYHADGRLKWTGKQFKATGIGTAPIEVGAGGLTGAGHLIEYIDYDQQGRLLAQNVDLFANGEVDLQTANVYDEFGRLKEVYENRRSVAARPWHNASQSQKLVSYLYDESSGAIQEVKHWVKDTNCVNDVMVDAVAYTRDVQERLLSIASTYMNYSMAYDANSINAANVTGPAVVAFSQNYNGNSNGWRVQYNLAGQGVTGFNQGTVYGFQYDGMNRLIAADASVFENNLQPNGNGQGVGQNASYNTTGNYGLPLNGNIPKAWYGDERYSYDKIGNLTGMRRYHYFAPGFAPGVNAPAGTNWVYEYYAGTNRLRKLTTNGGGNPNAQANDFIYDGNGNVRADLRRGLGGMDYNASNLPYHLSNGQGNDVKYSYGSGNQRVYRKVTDTAPNGAVTTQETYYLRDASGKVLAVHATESQSWTFELYGGSMVAEWECADAQLSVLGGGPTFLPDVKFMINDHLGNIRVAYKARLSAACAPANKVVSVIDYTPYGRHLRSWFSEGPERWQTTGNERDIESGLDYRGARYYDSEYGRFLGVDALANGAPGWNGYRYGFDNPVRFVDMTGMYETDGKDGGGGGGGGTSIWNTPSVGSGIGQGGGGVRSSVFPGGELVKGRSTVNNIELTPETQNQIRAAIVGQFQYEGATYEGTVIQGQVEGALTDGKNFTNQEGANVNFQSSTIPTDATDFTGFLVTNASVNLEILPHDPLFSKPTEMAVTFNDGVVQNYSSGTGSESGVTLDFEGNGVSSSSSSSTARESGAYAERGVTMNMNANYYKATFDLNVTVTMTNSAGYKAELTLPIKNAGTIYYSKIDFDKGPVSGK